MVTTDILDGGDLFGSSYHRVNLTNYFCLHTSYPSNMQIRMICGVKYRSPKPARDTPLLIPVFCVSNGSTIKLADSDAKKSKALW
ncbi:MAG: hypothetical protein DRJ01_18325 [Bacteroidetes bacterium]|nr:MAG: hypothetical protein DRJ01_18325 [Bacteroidota bacterium]